MMMNAGAEIIQCYDSIDYLPAATAKKPEPDK
jgi:hypothetical protein